MGDCIYCGKPAGRLRKQHPRCHEIHLQGREQFVANVLAAVDGECPLDQLEDMLIRVRASHYIRKEHVRPLLVRAWETAVERALEDTFLSEREERTLTGLAEYFGLSQDDLDRQGAYTSLVKLGVLRDLYEGKPGDRVTVKGDFPFNLQKSERLLWLFTEVDYYEQKKRVEYVGGSSGVSFRVARGVYYRTGAFRGHRVERTDTVHGGRGLLAVTTKHLYFGGDLAIKPFRVRLDKIVAFYPYSDGIGIQRDAATALPQLFVTGDGWFTYNLVRNAANI